MRAHGWTTPFKTTFFFPSLPKLDRNKKIRNNGSPFGSSSYCNGEAFPMVKPRSAKAVNRSDLLVNSGLLATDFYGGFLGRCHRRKCCFSKPCLMSRGKLKGIWVTSADSTFFESKSRYGFLDKKGKQHDGLYKNGFHDDAIWCANGFWVPGFFPTSS